MLIETEALNLQEVGEKSLDAIKLSCLQHFAHCLRECILESNRSNLSETYNYTKFKNLYAEDIKYNSKNVIFESVIYNNGRYSVQDTCADLFMLRRIEAQDTSNTYFYEFWRNSKDDEEKDCCEAECCSKAVDLNRLLNFHKFFGVGEFPYITITVIRIGNVDHYFYRIHR